MKSPFQYTRALALVAVAVTAAACGDFLSDPQMQPDDPSLNTGGTDVSASVDLCKVGPVGVTFNFTITPSTDLGIFPWGKSVSLTPEGDLTRACKTIWRGASVDDPTIDLTITEQLDPGVELYLIAVQTADGTTFYENPTDPSITVSADWNTGALVQFKNRVTELGDGCTPGYWRQPHHYDNWTAPYTPSTMFVDAFGVPAFPGLTLSEVVVLKGGDLNALGRHAVGALLNAASPDVGYALTVTEVINAFTAAFISGDYEATKDMFEGFNEAGCPLD